MISQATIDQFLKRELDDFGWLKRIATAQIEQALQADGVPAHLYSHLWPHQKASFLLMQQHKRFIFHIGMGGGKTLLMLTMLRLRKLRGEKVRAIVFVPFLSAVDTWVQEVKKFAPELVCFPLTGSSKENEIHLTEIDCDLNIISYPSAIHIKDFTSFSSFDTLILDEIHKVKNHSTKTFKLCKYLSERAEYVYGLTGTPFGKDLQDLWAEFYVIDFGETLGPNISFFRNVFFKKKFKFHGGVEYRPIKKRVPVLQRLIKNKSLHYSVKELSEVPDKQYIKLVVRKPVDVEAYVARELIALREAVKAKNTQLAGNAFMQLRQLSSGFVTFKDSDEQRIKVKFDENPKLDKLIELIDAMPPECKMVVFHDYIYTGDLIAERFKKLGIQSRRIYGGTRDKPAQLTDFRSKPSIRVMLLNSQSGSSSLNLQLANYVVFYECPSVIDREQAEARVWRPGQTNKVFIYDIFMTGTVDEQHYTSVKAGGDLLQEFLCGKKEVQ